MPKPINILFCIMNWGIGHATRSSVLVDELIQQGAKLTIASSGAAKAWLEQHYPQLQIKDKPGININYPRKDSIQWALVKQTPALLKLSTDEASWTEEMLNEHQFNAIISDNCYGCYHPKVVSILITHQLNLPLPQPMKMAAQNILNKQLKNFNEIWVPDHSKKPNFSGELSQTTDSRVNFIGPLSRFKPSAQVKNPQGWLGLVSGPEPRRTEFENELYHLLSRWPGKHHLFTGTIKPLNQSTDNLTVHSMNDSGSIAQLLSQSEGVICRSGYSSLMDIAQFNIPLILVPTKGQAEQEYLAKYWEQTFGVTIAKANELKNLKPQSHISKSSSYGFQARSVLTKFLKNLK